MRRRTYLILGSLLVVLGLFGTTLATIIVDTSPPIIVSSKPENNAEYSNLNKVSIALIDSGSGVEAVSYEDDHNLPTQLTLFSGTIKDGFWSATVSKPPEGNHGYKFTILDKSGNTKIAQGQYQVCYTLNGDWFIDDIKVQPDEILVSSDREITIKFVKSAGKTDNLINVKMKIDTKETPIPYKSTGIWETTYIFQHDGVYKIDLIADDGENQPITLALLSVGANAQIATPKTFAKSEDIMNYVLIIMGVIFISLPYISKNEWIDV